MQIILHHWTDIVLKSPAKKVNAPIIESCTGIKNYKGKAIQRSTMMRQITKENYEDMCRRVNAATDQDTLPGSTNFGRFMTWFSGEDVRWISSINDTLEQ
jgi:hypothetical protein